MRKKKTLILASLSLLLTAGIVTAMILMAMHEPGFYRRAEVSPGKVRKEMSGAFVGQFAKLLNYWKDWRGEWNVSFTEAQINSFFAEDFVGPDAGNSAAVLAQQGIADPRIIMENDKLRLAFRYGTGAWSTVLSYDLKLWLAPKEVNVVCVEILGRHAGALPIGTQSLLNEFSELAGKQGIEVTWYRHEGNPVALIRFQANGSRPTAQLRRLDVKQGWITIGGLSLEPVLTGNMKSALTPMGN